MKKLMNLFDEAHWEDTKEYPDGTKQKVLRDDKSAKTVLLKLPKDFYMAPHTHVTTEQHFVLSGQYTSEGKVYPRGSYQMFFPHEDHGPFESKNGALVLVTWDPFEQN